MAGTTGAWAAGDRRAALLKECDRSGGLGRLTGADGSFIAAWVSPDGTAVELFRSASCTTNLYLAADSHGPVWSAYVGDLVRRLGWRPGLDPRVVPALIAGVGLAPTRTWFKGVTRLPAGYVVRGTRSGWSEPRLAAPFAFRPRPQRSPEEEAETLRELIADAVRRSLGGRRVAISFSGGVDSSILALNARDAGCDVSLVHCSAGEDAERSAARTTARHLGLDLHLVPVPGAETPEPDAPAPYTHMSLLSYTAQIDMAARLGAETLAWGWMADQLFEEPTPALSLRQALNPMTLGLRPQQALRARYGPVLDLPKSAAGAHLMALASVAVPRVMTRLSFQLPQDRRLRSAPLYWLTPEAKAALAAEAAEARRWYVTEFEQVDSGRGDPFRAARWSTLRQSLEDLDYAALESAMIQAAGRCWLSPYCDRSLVEYALSLAPRYRVNVVDGVRYTKPLLRAAFAEGIPAESLSRTLQPPFGGGEVGRFHRRRAAVAAELGPKSFLARHDLIDTVALAETLSDRGLTARGFRYLHAALRLERWMQTRS
ncbi:MAG: asparagine synthase C-terminal domain-containing protein [Actinomycetota bacterium]